MFGVAGAEVFADFEVGGFPKGAEVGGDLDGAVVWAEEVEGEGDASGGDAWGVGPAGSFAAEEFLEADGEDGVLVEVVLDADAVAGGDGEGFGGVLVEEAVEGIGEMRAEKVCEVVAATRGAADVVEAAFAWGGFDEDACEVGGVEGGPGLFGHGFAEEGDAGQESGAGFVGLKNFCGAGGEGGGEDAGGVFIGDRGIGIFAEEEVAVELAREADDAVAGFIVLDDGIAMEGVGEGVFEPLAADAGGDGDEGFAGAETVIVAEVEGEEEFGVEDRRFRGESYTSAADHEAAGGVGGAAAYDAVGEGEEGET